MTSPPPPFPSSLWNIHPQVQERQSLHAPHSFVARRHIVLWLDGSADEIDAVCNEISACLPCDEFPDRSDFDTGSLPTLPGDDISAAQMLFIGLKRRNMHNCRPVGQSGCRKEGHCNRGFPGKIQTEKAAVYNDANQRYQYYRPRECDRNVVPYHPLVALFWGAHTNIQRITSSAWSIYLLKYAVKVSALGCSPELCTCTLLKQPPH